MKHQFSRNELAYGQEGLDLLKDKTVSVLGVGGVGSFAAEALARTNIGHIILIDKDDVDITNVNRQIHALTTTIGQSKVTLMEERIKLINPNCKLHLFTCFILKRHMKIFLIITILIILSMQVTRLYTKFI